MTASERVLWEQLRDGKVGFAFRTQVRVKSFILDFYCAKAKLCLEVDGEQHFERKDYDAWRDLELEKLGIQTLRIPSLDLFASEGPRLEFWIQTIVDRCVQRTGVDCIMRRPRHERF